MINLEDLISRGYFPKELPPPFHAKSFGAAVGAGLPPSFELLLTRPTRTSPAFTTFPVVHNLARAGTLRRKLSIPNPVNQYQVAKEIMNSWSDIAPICSSSSISLTTPVPNTNPRSRAITANKSFSHIPEARARTRAGARYILAADLNAFYPSIYTHSIPWAIHGKAISKLKRTDYSLVGNRIDLALRNGQGQQTVGIPIGPDTSLVIAEIIGSTVDSRLPDILKNNAFRYVDDFECGFATSSEAESYLAILQNEFSEFELQLNPRKTKVAELPLSLEAFWVPHLRLFPIGNKNQRMDLLGFFGRAFELAREYREEAILKYAINRMRSVRITEGAWPLYEDLLLNCLAVESGTTPSVVSELCRYSSTHPLNYDRISSAFHKLITHHAPQHHGSEVAWSVWYLAKAGQNLTRSAANLALAIPDPIVVLCVLYAQSLGKIEAGVDFSSAEKLMTAAELMGPFWLLSYEAKIKGWLPSRGSSDHISASPHFDFLRNNSVSFFDTAANITPEPSSQRRESADYSNDMLTSIEIDEEDEEQEAMDAHGY